MAIITFWNDGKVETNQSMTLASIATVIALNHNYKILMINTKHRDKSLEYAFEPKNSIAGMFAKGKMDLETGLGGVAKAIMSNKTSPEIITKKKKIIFKNLELLTDINVEDEDFQRYIKHLKDIVKLANRYYDIVFVDLEGDIKSEDIKQLLSESNVIIATITQNINVIDRFMEEKASNEVLKKDNLLISMGKYDDKSKYTLKNVIKYIKYKRTFKIPYNTLFAMDAPEGRVADYFIKFKRINDTHINAPFINSVYDEANAVITTIKEQQRKIY